MNYYNNDFERSSLYVNIRLYKYSDASRIARTDLPVWDVNETVHGYAYLEINLHSSGAHI